MHKFSGSFFCLVYGIVEPYRLCSIWWWCCAMLMPKRYQDRVSETRKGVGTERAKKSKRSDDVNKTAYNKVNFKYHRFFPSIHIHLSAVYLSGWFVSSFHHKYHTAYSWRNSVPDLLLMFFESSPFDSPLGYINPNNGNISSLADRRMKNTKNNGSTTCDFQLTRWNFAHTFLLFLYFLSLLGWMTDELSFRLKT